MVHFYGVIYTPPDVAIVSEYMPNGALVDVLRSEYGRQLSLYARLRMAADAAAGVLHMHSEGIMCVGTRGSGRRARAHPPLRSHRDLSARNLLVDRQLTVKGAAAGAPCAVPALTAETRSRRLWPRPLHPPQPGGRQRRRGGADPVDGAGVADPARVHHRDG